MCVGLLPVNDWPLSGLGYWFVASSGGRVNKAAKGRASDTKFFEIPNAVDGWRELQLAAPASAGVFVKS
jgi:hypothetical protein